MSPDDVALASGLALAACLSLAFGGLYVADRAEQAPGTIAGVAMAVAGAMGSIAALVAGG